MTAPHTPFSVVVLGPMHVEGTQGPVPLGGRKQRLLFADLLIHRGVPLSAERLAFDLWGDDPPPTWNGTLSAYVSRLRATFGADAVDRSPSGYVLDERRFDIDADRFLASIDTAIGIHARDPHVAADGYRQALGLWRGDAFGEIGYEHFARAESTRLAQIRLDAVERLYTVELELGHHREAIPGLQAAVEDWPYVEGLWHLLMLSLYRSGRQAEALSAFRRAARVLGDELGISPGPELVALEERILLQDPGLGYRIAAQERSAAAAETTNLATYPTAFIGRDETLRDIRRALQSHRLVTFVGPGGVGKTRLAVETGWAAIDRYPDGVWEVDLAVTSTRDGVLDAFASTLTMPQVPVTGGSISAHLANRHMLVLVDNCEHVLDEVRPIITAILDHAPNVTVLTTSRSALGLDGELVVGVDPLPLPDLAETDPRAIARSDAVALFESRGAAVHEGFRVTSTNAEPAAAIVRALDGMPLAIELAASRLALLAPVQLEREVTSDAFPHLAGSPSDDSRHATLRAVVDWSYDLLSDPERDVFNDLAVFAGPFSADAAAALEAGGIRTADAIEPIIEGLVVQSLVAPASPGFDGIIRYRLLDTLRRYGRERLAARGGLDDARSRHLRWVLSTSDRSATDQYGPMQGSVYRYLEMIRSEIEAALAHASQDAAALTRLHRGLWRWWLLQGNLDEAAGQLAPYVASMDPDTLDLAAAWSLIVAERLTVPGDLGTATPADAAAAARGVVAATDRLDDPELRARCLLLAGDAFTAVDEYTEAEEALRRAIDAYRDGPDWALGWAYLRLVRVAAFGRTDFAEADRLLELARGPLQRSGDLHLLAYWTLIAANRAHIQSRFPDAYALSIDAAVRFEEIGSDVSQADALRYAVLSAIGLGRYRETAAHIDRMLAITRRRGLTAMDASTRFLALDVLLAEGRADEVLEQIVALGRTAMPDFLTDRARRIQADALTGVGRADEAVALIPEITAAAERDLPWLGAGTMMTVGEIHLATGRASEAIRAFRVAAEWYAVSATPHGVADALEAIAAVRRDAPPDLVATMLGVVGTLRDDVGAVPSVARRARNRTLTTTTARRMRPDEFTTAWQGGAEIANDTPRILQLASAALA